MSGITNENFADFLGLQADCYLNLEMADVLWPSEPDRLTERGHNWLVGVARLADGVTGQQADSALEAAGISLAEQWPESNAGETYVTKPYNNMNFMPEN